MYYSAIPFMAILVLFLENYDVIFRKYKNLDEEWKYYKLFLYVVFGYYITDFFWGLLYANGLSNLLYIDTVAYYVMMPLGILFLSKYITTILKNTRFSKFIMIYGNLFFVSMLVLLIINFFKPIIFTVDSDSEYHPFTARYVMLIVQITFIFLNSIYLFIIMGKKGGLLKKRYRAIGVSELIMGIFLIIQLYYPNLPLYSAAFMLGTCVLHAFVIKDENEEYKRKLDEASAREQQNIEDLKLTKLLAYTDGLTGAESKVSYIKLEEEIDIKIRDNNIENFALAVLDINDLKQINDIYGHDKGDEYIIKSYNIIKNYFKDYKIYRIGGDEFVVYIENAPANIINNIKNEFTADMTKPKDKFDPIIAIGISSYSLSDNTFGDVFRRADKLMYKNKSILKELNNRIN